MTRLLIVGLGLIAASTSLAEPSCKGGPDIRECHVFHDAVVFQRSVDGIIAFSEEYSAEAPWWRVAGERALPARVLYDLRRNPTVVVHGDIEACFRREPVSRDETVCIESIANPVVRIPQYD